MTTLAFCDLPDARRMAYRDLIEDHGGQVEGYCGTSVQVAIPAPSGPFFEAMATGGLELEETSLHLFPLGSDAPPQHLRHRKSYWLFGRFVPRP